MKIETKYNIKDEVYFIFNNKIKSGTITFIVLTITSSLCRIEYEIPIRKSTLLDSNINMQVFDEENLFSSKEELIKSL